MKKLILVCGLSGSGKTTIAKELSKKLNIACLHKDEIKEVLYDSMEGKTLKDSKKFGVVSMNILFSLIEAKAKNGVDIIAEAPFTFEEDFDFFAKINRDNGTEIFSVICEIDEEERIKRIRGRRRHDSHHDEERQMEYKKVDYKKIIGEYIYIKTHLGVEDLVNNILKRIK